MNINLTSSGKAKNKVYFVAKNQKTFDSEQLKKFCSLIKLSGEDKFKVDRFVDSNTNIQIVVKYSSEKVLTENMEDIVANIGDIVKTSDKKLHIDLDKLNISDFQKQVFAELLAIKMYDFNQLKSKKVNTNYGIYLKCNSIDSNYFSKIVESTDLCRDLVNLPTNYVNPEQFESKIQNQFAGLENIKINVLDKQTLKKLGMGGIYEVGKGAQSHPRLVLIEYKPLNKESFDYAMVGKGVCFDTGGYNLKPTGAIEDMRLDMGGAATVVSVLNYLAGFGEQKNILVAVPLVENNIDADAYKPGDVITMYNGTTVEISNTDAEGRLILADAISYIQEKYQIDKLFDVATLTGAQVVALGNKIAALIGNNSKLNNKIQKFSRQVKDRCWELPYYTPYFQQYKSFSADMKNVNPNRMSPGTITAGLFISQFVKNKNWVHFDIAGPVGLMSGPDPIWGEGASGFLVRMLSKYIQNN
ncbi:M17 family metallopeptidase [Candidatus Absconditicoccus praedator]|uniref:M17 family metallopeptidase n=1 Tax=Candidatus Absconditicoccus praedator TaxID=2735562 RepID=UPI001E3F69F5|nr:leucyl aminopeptidase family protein [Candidatus Absconditicoccus praedator]UFX83151.1 leucyl aminopeptidase [Candidatus Absconditicoccus praedator]